MKQLQDCLQSAIKALLSDEVLSEEDVAEVVCILEHLDDPETASETLHDVICGKAKSDPNIVVTSIKSVGKVNSNICSLLLSSPHLTWQQLKQKRNVIVQTLDTSTVIDACVEKGIVTDMQRQLLMKLKEKGKSSDFVADRFLRQLEKWENEEGSQLQEFEKILLDKQPDVLKALLETSK